MIETYLDAEGRVTLWPARKRGHARKEILKYLASKFDRDRSYVEREVNEILRAWHLFDDPALLRREMYDARILDRNLDGTGYRLMSKLSEAADV